MSALPRPKSYAVLARQAQKEGLLHRLVGPGRHDVRVPRKNQQWALIAALGPEITDVHRREARCS